jgi:hypothetical protein
LTNPQALDYYSTRALEDIGAVVTVINQFCFITYSMGAIAQALTCQFAQCFIESIEQSSIKSEVIALTVYQYRDLAIIEPSAIIKPLLNCLHPLH